MGTALATTVPDEPERNDLMALAAYADKMGRSIAAFVNCGVEQGAAIALTCYLEKITPLQYLRTYHTIQGKPCMRADAMLARFNQMNWLHRVIEASPKRAAIAINAPGTTEWVEFEFTWEAALNSRWPWAKDKGPGCEPIAKNLKDNWSTEEDRENMLWCRLVSKTIRKLCPSVVAGLYTPEEIIDVEYEVKAVAPAAPSAQQAMADLAAREAAAVSTATPITADAATNESVEDATYEMADALPATTAPAVDHKQPGSCSESQRRRIVELWQELGISDEQRQQQLSKERCGLPGVNALHSFAYVQAQNLIDRMEEVRKCQLKN